MRRTIVRAADQPTATRLQQVLTRQQDNRTTAEGEVQKGPESKQRLGNTIGYYLTAQSRRLGHKNAIRVPHQGVSWTYIDLKKNVCALANGFFEPDVLRGKKDEPCTSPTLRPGDRVLTCLGNNADFYAIQMSCAKAGAVMVPMNPYTVTKEAIEAAMKKYRPRAIIVKEHASVPSPALKRRYVNLVKELAANKDASADEKLHAVKRWLPEYNDETGRSVVDNLSTFLAPFYGADEQPPEPPSWEPWPMKMGMTARGGSESIAFQAGAGQAAHQMARGMGSPYTNPDHPNNVNLAVRWNGRRTSNWMEMHGIIDGELARLGYETRSNWELFYQVLPELDQNISENSLLHIERHPDLLFMACTDHNQNLPGTVPLRNVMQWQQQDYYADRLRKVARILNPDTAVCILPDSADGEVIYTHRNLMTAGYHVSKLLKMGNDTKVGVMPNCAHVPCGAIIAPYASLAAGSSLSVLGESLWNGFHVGPILNALEVERVEGIFVTTQHLSLLTPTVWASGQRPGLLKWICVVGPLQLSPEQCQAIKNSWKVDAVYTIGGPPESANQLYHSEVNGQTKWNLSPNTTAKRDNTRNVVTPKVWLQGPGIAQQRWGPSGVVAAEKDKDGFVVHDAGLRTWDDGGGNGSWLMNGDDFASDKVNLGITEKMATGVDEVPPGYGGPEVPGLSKAMQRTIHPDMQTQYFDSWIISA